MDDWDSIDWDEKVDKIVKSQQKNEAITEIKLEFIGGEDNGNYFEANQETKKQQQQKKSHRNHDGSSKSSSSSDRYVQPHSYKDLERIRGYAKSSRTFHNLIFETFGQFEKFLMTHEVDLTNEALVELLIIDASLLEIPFLAHNQLLLREISKIDSFWCQLIKFLQDFLTTKHQDMKFLLTVDMNRFFDNIESLLHNLIVNNLFSDQMENIFKEIVDVMEKFVDNKWSCSGRLRNIQESYGKNRDVYKIYDIFPCLDDFSNKSQNLNENLIKGEYENVAHYLQVHLPLLKEDFLSKLRCGVQQLKSMDSIETITKTPDIHAFPSVQIKVVDKFMWNMNCKVTVVRLNTKNQSTINWSRRFFTGQILCFSSSKDFSDLIIATVISKSSPNLTPDEIIVEIVKTENISDIFDRDLMMVEPTTFFEPYHKVFNVLKNHNELNFPFKNQILKLEKVKKFPSYQSSKRYTYKDFTFSASDFNSWPSHEQLYLELMQLKAIQTAVTSEFSIIQGPPGTGKTFVGLEVLKILLENTNETILILTQTNNALDKFLIGASAFTESIVRMGGQCKSEELERFKAKSLTPFESKKYMKKLQAQLEKDQNLEKISEHHRLIEEIHQLSAFCSINEKRVVGMTTTFAARSTAINKMLKPGIVIVEEASEVLESHVLVALTRETKQLIMIGDHQQLKPLTNSYDLAKNFNFNVSLFERLIRNDFDFITLDVQMRMKPEICDLVRGTIYKSLKDGAIVESYAAVKGMPTNFFCVDHSSPESVGDGETSKENIFEAKYIVELCNLLISKKNEPKNITILTAYAAQAQRITKLLKHSVRVAVLDAYQGEESEIILLSLVRSNNRRDIGFLSTENRVAVVLSRAKLGFYIIANMKCLASASGIWRKVQEILTEKKAIGPKIPDVNIFVD